MLNKIMVSTWIAKPGKEGDHFVVREKSGNFNQTEKVRKFYPKYGKNQEILTPKWNKYWKSQKLGSQKSKNQGNMVSHFIK